MAYDYEPSSDTGDLVSEIGRSEFNSADDGPCRHSKKQRVEAVISEAYDNGQNVGAYRKSEMNPPDMMMGMNEETGPLAIIIRKAMLKISQNLMSYNDSQT